jgi:hypothetical protein
VVNQEGALIRDKKIEANLQAIEESILRLLEYTKAEHSRRLVDFETGEIPEIDDWQRRFVQRLVHRIHLYLDRVARDMSPKSIAYMEQETRRLLQLMEGIQLAFTWTPAGTPPPTSAASSPEPPSPPDAA